MFWQREREIFVHVQPTSKCKLSSFFGSQDRECSPCFVFMSFFSVNLTEKYFIYLFTFQAFLFYFTFSINLTAKVLFYYFVVAVVNLTADWRVPYKGRGSSSLRVKLSHLQMPSSSHVPGLTIGAIPNLSNTLTVGALAKMRPETEITTCKSVL